MRNELRKEFGMTYIKNFNGYANVFLYSPHVYCDTTGISNGFDKPIITGAHELMYALMANPKTRRTISHVEAWRLEFLPPTPPRESD